MKPKATAGAWDTLTSWNAWAMMMRADPEQDAERGFHGQVPEQEGHGAGEADDGDGDGVEDGIAGARAEGFPAGMADVDGGREGIAEEDADNGADPVDEEGGAGVELVAGGLGAFEVEHGSYDVEHGHGDKNGGVGPDAVVAEEAGEFVRDGHGRVEAEMGVAGPWRGGGHLQAAEHPRSGSAGEDGDEAGGQAKRPTDAPAVADEDEHRGEDSDERRGENLEDETHRDESDAYAGERGEQRGARRVLANPAAAKGGGNLDDAAEQAGDEGDAPGEVGVVGLVVDRAHDEENEGEEADGVDAEGQRGDGPPGLAREAHGLPRVEEISGDEGDGDAGQDAADDEGIGQAGDTRAEADDDHELAQVVDEEAEEAIDVAGDKPGRARCGVGLGFGGHLVLISHAATRGRAGNEARAALVLPCGIA